MSRFPNWLPFIPVLAVLCLWLPAQMQTSLNTNHAWLAIAAQRWLAGGHALTDFYEGNPPLSVMLYVPAVLLTRLSGIPVYYTVYGEGLLALVLSVLAVRRLLAAWPALGDQARNVFLGAYVIASTLVASRMFFAERDEFVIWGLMPFLLAQLAITRGRELPRVFTWCVLLLGAICILIKPHYLLLPGALLLYRMIVQKRFSKVLKDSDCISLVIAAALYALAIALFFRDYAVSIFPDFVSLYLPLYRLSVTFKTAGFGAALLALLCAASFLPGVAQDIRRGVRLCAAAAALCGLMFVAQGKGNYYHQIPFLAFFYTGLGLLLYGMAARVFRAPQPPAFIALTLLALLAFMQTPVKAGFPVHADYRQLPLTKLAREAAPGAFFVFSEGMEMIHQAALYGGAVHASRFPDLWWLNWLLDHDPDGEKAKRYAGYVAADIARWKPAVMAIDVSLYRGGGRYFDLIGWLSERSPAFREEMKHYSRDGQLTDNRRDYFRGTALDYDHRIVYDIYRRIP